MRAVHVSARLHGGSGREVHAGRRASWLAALAAVVAAVVAATLLAGCGGSASGANSGLKGEPSASAAPASPTGHPATELRVFAAASLTEAFTEAGRAFEAAHPGVAVTFNFAGSQALRTQLAQGARADLLASADEETMAAAQRDGTIAGEPRVFARNRLVLIVPAANPSGIARLQDLARPGVKLVLAGPQVPVGAYARQSLAAMERDPAFGPGFAQRVLGNVVSEETNVKQVVAKVQLGEADAGIVYASDVTPAARDAVRAIEIPDRLNVVARYPIALVRGAADAATARAFVDFLLSPTGQAILAHHGFLPAAQAESSGG